MSGVNKSPKKVDLTSLKSDIDDLDIDKLRSVPVDLINLGNVVKNILLKRLCVMNWVKKLMLFRLFTLVI